MLNPLNRQFHAQPSPEPVSRPHPPAPASPRFPGPTPSPSPATPFPSPQPPPNFPKCGFKRKTCQNFRSKRFRQNVSIKTFGQTLNPKPHSKLRPRPGPGQQARLSPTQPPHPGAPIPKHGSQKKTFSVKTFGQNLLAPKPLTISINPKP